MNQPISNFDILDKLHGRTRIIFYEDLNNVSDVNQLLDLGSVVILYKSKPDYGHWTALLRTPEGIEFFDSYGQTVDEAKNRIDSKFLKKTNQYRNILAELLYIASISGIPIHYNEHQFQERSKSIATCGKHVVLRILRQDLTTDEYNKLMKSVSREYNLTPDEIVNIVYSQL